ncbi:MAG TPA: vanadium-dependent haloperoxidase [Vicinamibacteria bacterium]|nr:vanadium-dependent haloperoxidase [Vicinamibacteria bacterium]
MRQTVMLALTASLACAGLARADAVSEWSLIAQGSIVTVEHKFPGEAAVYMGIVHAAMYDAAVGIEGGYRPYRVSPTAPRGASLDAAVATAAHQVLVQLFPGQQSALDVAYEASLAAIPDGQAKSDGISVGGQVGDGYLDLPAIEGLNATVPYVQPPPGPGVWEPTAATPPLGTKLPLVVPLTLDDAAQYRPDGPLPLGSHEYASDVKEVKKLGRVDSTFRTVEQTQTALFWTDHDIPQWNRNLVRLAAERGLRPAQTARMLAMAHVAGGDAMIACFDAKYHYLSWRPLHAIQRADTDGNPLTEPDPSWQPLRPTPNHPEYPSAHACHTTAITVALERFFGTNAVPFSLDSLVTGETRHYDRLKDVVKEVNNARVWAGFHFRNSDNDGSALGRKVGRFVAQRFFRPTGCHLEE